MKERLIFNNVTKTFKLSKKQQKISRSREKTITACNGISFSVMENEIFGLLGPNGAGKTTALRMAATLIQPDSGDITIDGISYKDGLKVREKIAFLTNDLRLEENFTPNYLFDFFSSIHKISEDASSRRKKLLFERFGIDKFAEVKIKDLSQGMRQKISIAVSLVNDPEIIIFDEPTNGLDVITAKTVTDYLLELKAQGKTIILSTHIMNLIEKLCDRVGIIIAGKVVLVENVASLLKEHHDIDELFFKLYVEHGGNKE